MRRGAAGSTSLPLALLRTAGLLVPHDLRVAWLAEWKAELWYVPSRRVAFSLGAFRDALWLRRNTAPRDSKNAWLKSPVECIFFLAIATAASVVFAFRPGGPGELIFPRRATPDLVSISSAGHAVWVPAISFADYRSLADRTKLQFAGLAFYRPLRMRVPSAARSELAVALASGNLFDLLNLHVDAPAVILNHTAWRKYFGGDPHIVGRILQVGERRVPVAGVLPLDSWPLPDQIDLWMFGVDLPPDAKGFVLGRVRAPASAKRWHFSILKPDGSFSGYDCALLAPPNVTFAYLLMILVAIVILPTSTSLALGDYPANGSAPPWRIRLRRWIFLTAKLALVVPGVSCATLALASLGAIAVQPHVLLVGYILAFRWVLIDQRRRCPVCLCVLTNPTRIGRPSQTFLEWYGTELICTKGHGLLHVPEIPSSCYGTQRWLYLDPSWSGLFS